MTYQSHDSNPLPTVESVSSIFLTEYPKNASDNNVLQQGGTIVRTEGTSVEDSQMTDSDDRDKRENVADVNKISPAVQLENDPRKEATTGDNDKLVRFKHDQKPSEIDENDSVMPPVQQERIPSKSNARNIKSAITDDKTQAISNVHQNPDETSIQQEYIASKSNIIEVKPAIFDYAKKQLIFNDYENSDQTPVRKKCKPSKSHVIIEASKTDGDDKNITDADQKLHVTVKLDSVMSPLLQKCTSSKSNLVGNEADYVNKPISNADQQPDEILDPVMQGPISSKGNRIRNEKNEQRSKCMNNSLHRNKRDVKLITYLIIVVVVFVIGTSLCAVFMEQHITMIMFCTLIPIFYTLFALMHWFLNQKPVYSTLRRLGTLRQKNITFS